MKAIKIGIHISLLLLLCTGTFSCKTRQKLVYFHEAKSQDTIYPGAAMNFCFKPNDIVSIVVSGAEPDLVKPFNLNISGPVSQEGYELGSSSRDGYLIDQNGEINFPVIGKIKIAGLNRAQAIDLMTSKIKVYVNDPIVNMRVTNFKITVLGSVQRPGTYNIPNERITILEALGLSQDTKITGLRNNVLVIRENEGKKQEFRIDLTSKETYNSPAYYLQQNDVVYVEPNRSERLGSTVYRTSTSIALSSVTIILTALNIMLSR